MTRVHSSSFFKGLGLGLETKGPRSWSWSRVITVKVSNLVSSFWKVLVIRCQVYCNSAFIFIFSSYDKHVKQAETGRSANPSVAAVVMLYIDSLPSLTAHQARSSSNPWPLFREDKRFSKLHKFLRKKCCVYLQHLLQWKEYFRIGGFSCAHTGPVWDLRSSQTWSLPSATNI